MPGDDETRKAGELAKKPLCVKDARCSGEPGTPVGVAGPDARCSELLAWMDELGIDAGDAARYAAALVELGVDAPADVALLREGDWPAAIKPMHLRKMQEGRAPSSSHARV